MTQVTRMQDKFRPGRQSIDLCDRLLEGADDILVRIFIESDMTVADLDKAEVARRNRIDRAQDLGSEYAAAQGPKHTRARPGHAFQKTTAIDAVGIMIV